MSFKTFVFALLFAVSYSMGIYAERPAKLPADNVLVTVEITGVNVNGGRVYVGIFTNEQEHRKDNPYASFILESTNGTLFYEIELPQGDCSIWAYQDSNGNGRLDTGFLGIPNEPVGLTNYNGRGIPGRFNRHKVPVNSSTGRISINLDIIRL